MDLSAVNSVAQEGFIQIFGNVVERFDKCAEFLYLRRPYNDVQSLINTAHEFLDALNIAVVEEIARLHPDLAGQLCDETNLTAESKLEQRAAGLRTISSIQSDNLKKLNELYKNKFGFPFIICARENKFQSILDGLQNRLGNSKDTELRIALVEIKKIVHHRIRNIFL